MVCPFWLDFISSKPGRSAASSATAVATPAVINSPIAKIHMNNCRSRRRLGGGGGVLGAGFLGAGWGVEPLAPALRAILSVHSLPQNSARMARPIRTALGHAVLHSLC